MLLQLRMNKKKTVTLTLNIKSASQAIQESKEAAEEDWLVININ